MRRTGQTTKMVFSAAAECFSGGNVVIVTPSDTVRRYIEGIFKTAFQFNCAPSVTFINAKEHFERLRGVSAKVFVDHSVDDLTTEQIYIINQVERNYELRRNCENSASS